MRVGQDLEGGGSEHESEEDQPADPDDEREQHEEAEEGHDGRIIVASAVMFDPELRRPLRPRFRRREILRSA